MNSKSTVLIGEDVIAVVHIRRRAHHAQTDDRQRTHTETITVEIPSRVKEREEGYILTEGKTTR